MLNRLSWILIAVAFAFSGSGCAHYEGLFTVKTEGELDAMEQSADAAAKDFRGGRIENTESAFRARQDDVQVETVPQSKPLSGKAAQMVGTWRSWLEVEGVKKRRGEDASEFADYMPVSGEITLELKEDGVVRVTELESRTFGRSVGTWKYRHEMLEMELTAENGEKYTMNGLVKWQGVDAFTLQYMVNDWWDLMKMRTAGLGDGITVICQYQGDRMLVVIVCTGEEFKIVKRTYKINVFRRQ